MPPALLYLAYLAVMTGGLACFLQAWRHRFDTPRHKRWGLTGVAVSLAGIVTVLLGAWALGWTVPERWPGVVAFHRRAAYVGTALLLLTAVTGALRLPLHKRLYVVFLPVYVIVLLTAAVGYFP